MALIPLFVCASRPRLQKKKKKDLMVLECRQANSNIADEQFTRTKGRTKGEQSKRRGAWRGRCSGGGGCMGGAGGGVQG